MIFQHLYSICKNRLIKRLVFPVLRPTCSRSTLAFSTHLILLFNYNTLQLKKVISLVERETRTMRLPGYIAGEGSTIFSPAIDHVEIVVDHLLDGDPPTGHEHRQIR